MAAEIAQLRQQLKFTKETLEDVRDCHGSEIRSYQGELESLKEHKDHIEKIVGELQAKQEGSRVNLTDAHHQVTQLKQANAQLEAYNQDLEKKYQGLKKVVASTQASTPQQTPRSSHDSPLQSLHKVIVAKPETGVVKPEVSTLGGPMVSKPSNGPVTQVIKAQPLDIVQPPKASVSLRGACAFPPTVGPSRDPKPIPSGSKGDLSPGSYSHGSGTHKQEPPSPPNGSEVRPKKVDHSNLHPGSAPHSNRPSAGTQVPAPAPKEDTLDHLGSTIHEQAPGNVYQGGSASSGGMKTVPRMPRDCGPRPPGRDIPQHQKEPPSGYHYGRPPPGREQPPHRYKSPPPLSRVTQQHMANFHHITPTMEKATMSQRLGPSLLCQAPGSYHGSHSCPSSGYPALSETHYHPSQVPSSAQRSVTEHTHSGGRNTGPFNPPGPAPTHNLVYPPGHNVSAGYSGPPGHGDPPLSASQPHTVNTLNPHDP